MHTVFHRKIPALKTPFSVLSADAAFNQGMSSTYQKEDFIEVQSPLLWQMPKEGNPESSSSLAALPVEGKVTVVELWSTRAQSCKESIPHLNALAKEFENDLVVVGITDEDVEDVKLFRERMGANMNYHVLCFKTKGVSSWPINFPKVEERPFVLVYDKDGKEKFRGQTLDPKFEETLRSELESMTASKENRRAVFLEAANLPRMDKLGFGKSDPFCAIFVRRKKSKHDRWAMCSLGSYFPATPVKTSSDSMCCKTHSKVPDRTIETLLMATEVLRDCSDPVWSNPVIFDSAAFDVLSDWEVLFAVYDHVRHALACPLRNDCNLDPQDWDDGTLQWQEDRIPTHRRAARVLKKYKGIRPDDLKDDESESFFVTHDMIQKPDTLFCGTHQTIGKWLTMC